MEVSITKISANGQVVIPSEVRKEAGIKPSTKFIVFSKGGNVVLKQIKEDDFVPDMKLIQKILKADKEIRSKKSIKADGSMSVEEIDDLLMKG